MSARRRLPHRTRAAQRGLSLLPAIVFLVIVGMLGVSALGTSVLEERMTGNARDQNIAFQAAEAALRDAEGDIDVNLSPTSPFGAACTAGLCTPPSTWATPSSTDIAKLIDWGNPMVTRRYGTYTGSAALPSVSAQPVYVIELLAKLATPPGKSAGLGVMPTAGGGAVYRITALGVGARAETRVVLQSTYIVGTP